jgi:hypothetical protein
VHLPPHVTQVESLVWSRASKGRFGTSLAAAWTLAQCPPGESRSLFQLAKEYLYKHRLDLHETVAFKAMTALDSDADFLNEYAEVFRFCGYPLFSLLYQFSTDDKPRTCHEIVSLLATIAYKCIRFRGEGADICDKAPVPRLVVEEVLRDKVGEKVLRMRTIREYPVPDMTSRSTYMDVLPKRTSLSAFVGAQGVKRGTEKLPPPTTLVQCIQRVGYFLALKIENTMASLWDDHRIIPAAVNPSTSEGVCGLMKWMWERARNSRTRDEVLRAFCVAARSTLVPDMCLRLDDSLQSALKRMARSLVRGLERNENAEAVRQRELEVKLEAQLAALAARVEKHNLLVKVKFVKAPAELAKLTIVELGEQAKLRGIKKVGTYAKADLLVRVKSVKVRCKYTRLATADDIDKVDEGEEPHTQAAAGPRRVSSRSDTGPSGEPEPKARRRR